MPFTISGIYIFKKSYRNYHQQDLFCSRKKEFEYPQWEFQKQKIVENKQHLAVLILSNDFLMCKLIINNEIIYIYMFFL